MKKTDLYLKPGTYIKSSTTSGEVQGISLENFVVSVLNNPTCCPKPPGSPDGMLMTALPLNLTLQTVTDFVGNNSAIQLSTLRLGIRSDSSVTTQTSSVIQATTTNANLVIAPNGTGALIADIPDGTATGGNARGINAVDLQILRGNANQVAAGDYSVVLGTNNRAVSPSTVAIGNGNTAIGFFGIAIGNGCSTGDTGTIAMGTSNSSGSEYDVVSGGQSNIGNGRWSVIGGGRSNNQGSQYGTISGGQSNVASTNSHATVVGGQGNTSSGYASVTGGASNTNSAYGGFAFGSSNSNGGNRSFVGGSNNFSTGSRSFAMGEGVTASGNYSVIFGAGGQSSGAYSFSNGNSAFASGTNSVAFGEFCNSTLYTQYAIASGRFSSTGDAQQSLLTARREASLNSAATTVLSLDGTGTTNLIIPNGNNRLWAVKVVATAFVSVAGGTLVLGDSYMGEFTLLFKRVGGTSSVVGVNAGNIIYDTNMATAAFTFAAGASQDLQITFKAPTTASATTFRCVAKVELVEVAY
jgi:hypothetical protein